MHNKAVLWKTIAPLRIGVAALLYANTARCNIFHKQRRYDD
jgi:hypothetical protein